MKRVPSKEVLEKQREDYNSIVLKNLENKAKKTSLERKKK
jgi:hypothetical protein